MRRRGITVRYKRRTLARLIFPSGRTRLAFERHPNGYGWWLSLGFIIIRWWGWEDSP